VFKISDSFTQAFLFGTQTVSQYFALLPIVYCLSDILDAVAFFPFELAIIEPSLFV